MSKTDSTARCEHGLVVGLPDPSDPRECQACDWCRKCETVRRFDGEACTTCGYVWGDDDSLNERV